MLAARYAYLTLDLPPLSGDLRRIGDSIRLPFSPGAVAAFIFGKMEMRRRQRLTIEEAEARQPDLVKGQEWRGASAFYMYQCSNPQHEPFERRYCARAKSKGCPKCDVEKRIAEGRYFTNHDDRPELFWKNQRP